MTNQETTMEVQPDFEHYVEAIRGIVEEFRDVLAVHTAKLHQEAIARGGQAGSPQEAAELHRLRIACDHFLNALSGKLLMTRQDAQLLFDWIVRHYGYPGESERAPCKALPDGDDNRHCHDDTAGNPEGRRK
jgi:hypothetical protein